MKFLLAEGSFNEEERGKLVSLAENIKSILIKIDDHVRKTRKNRLPPGDAYYNEEKVSQQKAAYLHAENFLKDSHELTFEDKFNRLHDRVTLNETAHLKVAHIFLTFHPRDEISNDAMVQMARRYVKTAGFEDQPYLGYRHQNAGNPHLHILSTHILPDRR